MKNILFLFVSLFGLSAAASIGKFGILMPDANQKLVPFRTTINMASATGVLKLRGATGAQTFKFKKSLQQFNGGNAEVCYEGPTPGQSHMVFILRQKNFDSVQMAREQLKSVFNFSEPIIDEMCPTKTAVGSLMLINDHGTPIMSCLLPLK